VTLGNKSFHRTFSVLNIENTIDFKAELKPFCVQGIAGGTFLYITFFEVLPSELNVPKNRLLKVLFVILGFAVFSALLLALH